MAEAARKRLADQVLRSRPWKRATARAQEYLDGGRDLGALLRRVNARVESAPIVGDALADTRTLVRLLRAYAAGRYRDVAIEDLLLILSGFVYLVSPLDLIPDVVAGVGLLDDVAVLGFVLRSLPDVIGRFRAWEERQGPAEGIEVDATAGDAQG
ncbi:MAG: DUF1232 domain-containing protein [Nitriliruptor sp.]|uniref:YkvA family protein n=1 Tax=Nitriliruptor sp. TaxID=2448056 RepID=UPI00349FE296